MTENSIVTNMHISDRNHSYEDIDTPINKQPITSKGPVIIGAESWFGTGCQIMSDVKIEKYCIVVAGSVVVKDVPDYSIIGSSLAKVLRRYNPQTNLWKKQ